MPHRNPPRASTGAPDTPGRPGMPARRAHTLAVRLATGATALVLTACAGQRAPSPYTGTEGATTVELEVRNDNFADATLHALRGTERIRLGVVGGHGGRTFRLDWRFSQPLRIEIDLLAGGRCVTEPLQVDPGDELYLRIEPQLGSMAACR